MASEYVPYAGPIVTRAEAMAKGLPRYFTGIPCKHGHIAERQTSNRQCWGCKQQPSKEYLAAWHKANRDRVLAAQRVYREQNREKLRESYNAHYKRNAKAIYARNKARREADPELARKYREQSGAWHKKHPDRVKLTHRRWVLANPEKVAANDRAQRARRQNAEGKHTAAEIKELLEKQRGKCVYCSRSIRKKYHADHIVPLKRGGSNWIGNIQLTCPDCNFRKNDTEPTAFAARLGRLL